MIINNCMEVAASLSTTSRDVICLLATVYWPTDSKQAMHNPELMKNSFYMDAVQEVKRLFISITVVFPSMFVRVRVRVRVIIIIIIIIIIIAGTMVDSEYLQSRRFGTREEPPA